MILSKVIEQVRELKNGSEVSDERLRQMINTVEHMILTDIVSGREGDTELLEQYGGVIDMESDGDTELFAPAPYEEIYAQYCAAQIDLLFEESERYMNDAIVYNNTYNSLKRYWWQGHRQNKRYAYFRG